MAKSNKLIRVWIPGDPILCGDVAADCARQALNGRQAFAGPVHLSLVAVIEIPVDWPCWKRQLARRNQLAPTGDPQPNFVERSIRSALRGILWHEDDQLVMNTLAKVYQSESFNSPGVLVVVTESQLHPAELTVNPLHQMAMV